MSLSLSALAKFFLAFLLSTSSVGKSVYSFEAMPECGTDKEKPTCELKRVCETRSPMCAKPRWSKARGAWVKVETRDTAAKRMERAAYALTRAAVWLTRCKDGTGSVVEDCKKVNWHTGPRTLGGAALSSSTWESGYREDIMHGYAPAGRGADGEACVMQVMPQYIKTYADWTPAKPREEMTTEDWAQEILGDDVVSLERCYRVGMRMLVRMHNTARRKCPTSTIYGMYAMYGNGGGHCRGKTATLGDYAAKRSKTYYGVLRRWPNKMLMPAWAISTYGMMPGQKLASASKKKTGRIADSRYGNKPSRALPEGQTLEVIPGEVPVLLQLRDSD